MAASTALKTYFISLIATNDIGLVSDQKFIFDVVSREEMKMNGVNFLALHDLQKHFTEMNSSRHKPSENVYELLKQFIYDKRGSNFIIDKIPFMKTGTHYVTIFY